MYSLGKYPCFTCKALPLLFLLNTDFNIINKSATKSNSQKEPELAKSHEKVLFLIPQKQTLRQGLKTQVLYLKGVPKNISRGVRKCGEKEGSPYTVCYQARCGQLEHNPTGELWATVWDMCLRVIPREK